jgi:hypothetical protein
MKFLRQSIDDKQAAYEGSKPDRQRKKKIALVTTVDYVSVVNFDGRYIKALLDNDTFNENLIIK